MRLSHIFKHHESGSEIQALMNPHFSGENHGTKAPSGQIIFFNPASTFFLACAQCSQNSLNTLIYSLLRVELLQITKILRSFFGDCQPVREGCSDFSTVTPRVLLFSKRRSALKMAVRSWTFILILLLIALTSSEVVIPKAFIQAFGERTKCSMVDDVVDLIAFNCAGTDIIASLSENIGGNEVYWYHLTVRLQVASTLWLAF